MSIQKAVVLPVVGLAIGLTAFQFGNVSATEETAWGPQDRPTYTWNSPADHVTFNSITDNPYLGDERNFVRVREAGVENPEKDEITLEVGKEYTISIYYHNNASPSLNDSGEGISRNTFVRSEFPSYLNAGETGAAMAYISASNAEPKTVWDTTYLKAEQPVYLNFVPNSAVIHNNGTTDGTILSGDELLGSNGVTIGHYNNMWGMIPGCNEYGGYVTYNIRVDAPAFEVDKKAVLADSSDQFADEIRVIPGDKINFRLHYKNTGTTEQTNVTAHDVLPAGINYIEGTTYASSTRHPEGSKSPEVLFGDGLNLGAMIAEEDAWVTYSATVADDMNIFPCGETVVYNAAYFASNAGKNNDNTKITVYRACEQTPEELPNTGPGEVIMAILIILVISGGGYYFYRSQKMLRKVSENGTDSSDIVRDGIVKDEK